MSTSIKISLKTKTVTTIPHFHKKHRQQKQNTNETRHESAEDSIEEKSPKKSDFREFDREAQNTTNGNYVSSHYDEDEEYEDTSLNELTEEKEYFDHNVDDYFEEHDETHTNTNDTLDTDKNQYQDRYPAEDNEENDDEKDYVHYDDNESLIDEYEDNVLIHREDPAANETNLTNDLPIVSEDSLTTIDNCNENPNFAVVVDFLERFSAYLSLKKIPIKDLQNMICDTNIDIHIDLIQLHMDLLKKIKLVKNNSKKIYITKRSWETALVLFCNGTGNMTEIGEFIENDGYSRASISMRLVILKQLMESQFEWNEPLRFLVDDLPVENLRIEPTGRDMQGKVYWTQVNIFSNFRCYGIFL